MASSLFKQSAPSANVSQPNIYDQYLPERIQNAINFAKQFQSPKEAFYALAKQKGVDPNVIISMLKR